MGGTNSKEEERPVSGVQVTEGLIRQLSSETPPRPQTRPSQTVGPSWMPHFRPALSTQLPNSSQTQASQAAPPEESQETALTPALAPATQDPPVEPASVQPAAVEHAQEQIQQAMPTAELKAEAVSQQKVDQFADQLVEEYEAPLKALPCLDEKTSCLQCYQQHHEDPLRCAQQVAAFTKCAQKASAITVR